jgi:hypothetical protein
MCRQMGVVDHFRVDNLHSEVLGGALCLVIAIRFGELSVEFCCRGADVEVRALKYWSLRGWYRGSMGGKSPTGLSPVL